MKSKPALVVLALCCLTIICLARTACSASGPLPQSHSQTQTVTCSSDDMGRHTCPIDARGGVQLTRQISGSPCIFGRTWGYDSKGIWVDRGCRAEFQVGSSSWNGWDTG